MEHSEPFSVLPSELIAQVAGYLDPYSLNTFRVACKRINEVVVYTETDKNVYSKDIAICVKHKKTDLVKRHLDTYPVCDAVELMTESIKVDDMDTFMILLDHFYKLELKEPKTGLYSFLYVMIQGAIIKCLDISKSTRTRLFIIKAFLDKYAYGLEDIDIKKHCMKVFKDSVYNGETGHVKTLFDMGVVDTEWMQYYYLNWSFRCAEIDDDEMTRVIVSHGAVCPRAVCYAVQGRAYKMLDVLLEYGYEVVDQVFFDSLLKNNTELVRKLITHGANVNARAGYALRRACEFPLSFSIIRLLLDNGADPSFDESAALRMLYMNTYTNEESLEVASITRRMVQLGADINIWGSMLYWSCRRKQQAPVRVLLECGAELDRDMGVLNSPDIERMLLIVSQVDQEAGCIDKDKRTLALREALGEVSY